MKTNPLQLALALFVAAAVVYAFVLKPLTAGMKETDEELLRVRSQCAETEIALSHLDNLKSDIQSLEAASEEIRGKWLQPMLNSHAMRVRSLLGEIAEQSGLANVEYDEGAKFLLPLPRGEAPSVRTARRSVTLRMLADYAALASFVLRAEREFPLMTVQSMKIVPTNRPELQDVTLTLEWPCEGEVVR